ncbi:HRSL1 enzyme, partial [Climacteris rufus]|nr:HRSL1 enzyme [Climacteris rufus]
YQHWVIYVGDEDVIHVTDERDQSLSGSSMSVLKNRARVKRQHLKEVVGNNKWRVNNKYDHSYTPLPVKKVIQHAERWVGREVPYDVLESNCEHFVTWLRYGVAVSEQV